ncbi:MAG: hypothetical protein ABIQ86_16785 [Steroidobacteraceae bacterium]
MPAAILERAYWHQFLFGWFQAESLGRLRQYFGFALCFYFTSQFAHLLALAPFGPQFHFTIPIWYFKLLGIAQHVPWVDWIVFAALMISCVLFAIGKHTRTAIVAIFLCVAYLKGVRDSFSGDVHHREQPVIALLVIFLLSRCGAVLSRDAKAGPPARPVEDWEASWAIRAMQIYIAFFYFWALIGKLRISGLYWFTEGGRIQDMLIHRSLRDGVDAFGDPVNLSLSFDIAQHPMLCFTLGALVFGFELLAPLILFFRSFRMRLLFVLCATTFHFSNFFLMNVQFYLYPFVLMAFFNMRLVHEALRQFRQRWLPLGSVPRAPR